MLAGIDIGGTFTDLVLSDGERLYISKRPSTPHDPAQAMLAGLTALTPRLDTISRVSHGSTVATNAILERRGGTIALITTRGFRDILAIGRQERPLLYALQPQLPPPLIPRERCFEVAERMDPSGEVILPLDIAALDRVLDEIGQAGVDGVAVCLLHSYANPVHEQRVKERILERGMLEEWQVALSSEVLPQFREYERASTVALEAYVRPVMSRYLERLEERLPEACLLRMMKSDGGVMSGRRARRQAVHTALSGPAAGVIGGFFLAQRAGYDQVITMDIGGTSTDVALCPGHILRRSHSEIGGLPLRTRLLDIETIGAGGGSVVRLDAGGVLRVGPESAGADPGPILYGRGGRQVTVTDANAVLGRLDPDHFLGGAMRLHLEPARKGLAALARRMGMGVQEAARGIIAVTNTNIERALRRVSIARGYDPRHLTLFAFGGAGPLHACEVADRFQIPRVLVPRYPGVLCAFGLLMADVVLDYSQPVLETVTPETGAALRRRLGQMIAQAHQDLAEEGIEQKDRIMAPLLDVRYRGQSYELTIPFDEDIEAAFHAAHRRAYGHAMPEREVEVVNLRVQATGLVPKPSLPPGPVVENDGSEAVLRVRREGKRAVTLYDRERLRPGARFPGPALILQMDSTTFIPPEWRVRVDEFGNLVVDR